MRKALHEYPIFPETSTETQGNEEIKCHKRGLLDILETHACAGSEIGLRRHKVRTSGSKDGIPYQPSPKSMPCTSSSEESMTVSRDSKISSVNIVPNKADAALQNLSETLEYSINVCEKSHVRPPDQVKNTSNRPYTFKYHNKRKVSRETSCISDILPEQSNESLLDEKYSLNINKKMSKPVIKMTNIHSILDLSVTSQDAKDDEEYEFPSLDISEKELFYDYRSGVDSIRNTSQEYFHKLKKENPSHCPIGQFQLRSSTENVSVNSSSYTSTDCSRKSILQQRPHKTRKVKEKKTKPILRLFDCNKYPLTDREGNILQTANDQSLVEFKNGRPYCDLFKREIFDENGESSLSSRFKPYGTITRTSSIISQIPLYDFRGYPLLECDGSALANANGNPLILTDKQGNILYDINKHPVFDKSGIPVTTKDNCWFTPKGSPYRVFSKLKYPLTNSRGLPLYDVNNLQLLKCDQYGRPILDSSDEPVLDINRCRPTDPNFNPSVPADFESENIIVSLVKNKPVQIFNKQGFPLTDSDGVVLKNADGMHLLLTRDTATEDSTLFNHKCMFLRCRINKQSSQYSRHFIRDSNLGEDGTNNASGICRMSELALKDINGELVYDCRGRPIVIERTRGSRKYNMDTKTRYPSGVQVPSTSLHSNSFSSSTSDHTSPPRTLTGSSSSSDCTDIVFQPDTDMFGRPLYDSMNRPLFDKFGRPIYDLFMRTLYDDKGRPISDANGKRLTDGVEEEGGRRVNFDINYLTPSTSHILLGHTDLNGGPLFDSADIPLYNKNGKPLKDAFGRPLYDEDGLPLCNEFGLPASKQIKQKGSIIKCVEDKFQKIRVHPENDAHKGANGPLLDCIKHYNARVRITRFADGEEVLELLEIAPAFNLDQK